MAITRKLTGIVLTFDDAGTMRLVAQALVGDSEEGTRTGMDRNIQNGAVMAVAADLRDAVLAFAANAGKPVTLTEN